MSEPLYEEIVKAYRQLQKDCKKVLDLDWTDPDIEKLIAEHEGLKNGQTTN